MKNKKIAISIILLVVSSILFYQFLSIDNLKTAKLAEIPDDYYQAMKLSGGVAQNISGLSFSPDGQKVALVVKRNGQYSVFLNGVPGPWYDSIKLPDVPFSSDGKHFAYLATINTPDSKGDAFVVLDGKEQQHYHNSFMASEFSIDKSGRVAYTVIKTGTLEDTNPNTHVVFSGFSSDGAYDDVINLKISPDGQHAIYYGCTDNTPNKFNGGGECSLFLQNLDGSSHIIGGINGTTFYNSGVSEAIYKQNYTYSPDGQLLASFTGDLLTVNEITNYDTPPGNYDKKNIRYVIFSPDSKHLAYVVQGCVNGECSTNQLGDMTGGHWYIVADNKVVSAEYDEIQGLTFDYQNQISFFGRVGNFWSFVYGEKSEVLSDAGKVDVFPARFSRYNENYLYDYTDRNGKEVLIVNGVKQEAIGNFLFPSFTTRNKVVYISVDDKNSNMSLVIDGVVRDTHDTIIPIFNFQSIYDYSFYTLTPDNKIMYGAIDGRDITRVVENI